MALACTTITAAVPPTRASTTAADKAATAGRRLHQSRNRVAAPTRRAAIGRLPSQARRSSATAWALAYRRRGSFSRHFRQIISRSRGTLALSLRGGSGGCSLTMVSVSTTLSPPNGARPVSRA